MPPLPSEPLSRVLEVLDRLEIPWLIGGSVASSAHGIPRTTLDIDLVVDFPPERIKAILGNEIVAVLGARIRGPFTVAEPLIAKLLPGVPVMSSVSATNCVPPPEKLPNASP